MGISFKSIVNLHPTLYHMAESGIWESVRQHGLLSTTALLDLFQISGERRTQLEEARRPSPQQIRGPNREMAWIRDQRPLSDKKLAGCLQDKLTPRDWYRILNGKVFFWLTEERLHTLMAAYSDRPHLVLEVDTEELLKQHGNQALLTPLNTGSTSPMAFPRGPLSFLPPSEYDYEGNKRKKGGPRKAIVELTVPYSVPKIAEFTIRASHRVFENGTSVVREVVFDRNAG